MSLAALMTQPVTILRATSTVDRYGSTVLDWSNPTRQPVNAWIAQRDADELQGHRDGELSRWIGYFPSDVTIRSTDRVLRWGVTFYVAGPPNPAHRPTTGLHHYEVPLEVVEG